MLMLLESAAPTRLVAGALDSDVLSATSHTADTISGACKLALGGVGRAAKIEVAEAFNSTVREFLEEI